MLKVYSAKWCTYCNKLKSFLSREGVAYENVDIDEGVDQAMFLVAEGLRTIPQVFDSEGNYLGGCDDTIAKLTK